MMPFTNGKGKGILGVDVALDLAKDLCCGKHFDKRFNEFVHKIYHMPHKVL